MDDDDDDDERCRRCKEGSNETRLRCKVDRAIVSSPPPTRLVNWFRRSAANFANDTNLSSCCCCCCCLFVIVVVVALVSVVVGLVVAVVVLEVVVTSPLEGSV